MRMTEIQQALRAEGLDGWLFFDHHRRDPLAYRVLRFEPAQMVTRRWYYLIPAEGEPVALVHKIESHVLDNLPGVKRQYAGWQQQRAALSQLLGGCRRVAMQYSPECAVPYVSNVDAGTVELVRSCGVEIRTSANLIQRFEAVWSAAQYDSHKRAQVKVDAIRRAAFDKVSASLRAGTAITEVDVQSFILNAFEAEGMVTDHGPIVAVNANASNPHYEPTAAQHSLIREGDLLLIDLWAKLKEPGAVYYDITWTGYCGPKPCSEMTKVFEIVRGGRDAGVQFIQQMVSSGTPLAGFEVDDVVRGFIRDNGFGDYFIHRTGHSIGTDVHGNGANMDNLESHDTREIIPDTCFSIEPGIYLTPFGIRSEVNVFVSESKAIVTGEIQEALLIL